MGLNFSDAMWLAGLIAVGGTVGLIFLLYWLYGYSKIQWGASRARLEQVLLKCQICRELMIICSHGIPGYDHLDTGSRYCYDRGRDPLRQEQTTHP